MNCFVGCIIQLLVFARIENSRNGEIAKRDNIIILKKFILYRIIIPAKHFENEARKIKVSFVRESFSSFIPRKLYN